jgi:hypothetical protein
MAKLEYAMDEAVETKEIAAWAPRELLIASPDGKSGRT